jgi:hypothetical protein
MADSSSICGTCGHSLHWHNQHRPRHVFKKVEERDVAVIPTELWKAALRLLQSSWHDIHNSYDNLTLAEKNCLTREQHADLLMAIEEELR